MGEYATKVYFNHMYVYAARNNALFCHAHIQVAKVYHPFCYAGVACCMRRVKGQAEFSANPRMSFGPRSLRCPCLVILRHQLDVSTLSPVD